jgi:hypothetical protein
VRGKGKARLTAVPEPDRASLGAAWTQELRSLQHAHSTGKRRLSVERILAGDREDRG